MPSSSHTFFILGVLMTLVTADNYAQMPKMTGMTGNTTVTPSTSNTTSSFNSNYKNSSTTADWKGNGTNISQISTTMQPTTTIKPTDLPAITNSKSRGAVSTKSPRPKEPISDSDDSTGIIILVVIISVACIFGLACYFARKRGRRYSVDFNSRADDANIPLSTVDPEVAAGAATQNGLKTFESVEISTNEAGPDEEAEAQVEQNAEAEKPAADPAAEFAAPAKPPDGAEVQPKGEGGPMELSLDDKTDDEGLNSNKTSVESLREVNNSNSNNSNNGGDTLQQTGLFWDIPLGASV